MELYIQPNLTTFPTPSVLTGDAIRGMIWLGFSSETTAEQIVAAGYISVPEPGVAQPEDTILVVDKNDNDQFTTRWMPNTEYQQLLDERVTVGAARAKRNLLLQQSDWTQGKDIPDNISTPWATYRQALRDLTLQDGFPSTITWPTPPQQ